MPAKILDGGEMRPQVDFVARDWHFNAEVLAHFFNQREVRRNVLARVAQEKPSGPVGRSFFRQLRRRAHQGRLEQGVGILGVGVAQEAQRQKQGVGAGFLDGESGRASDHGAFRRQNVFVKDRLQFRAIRRARVGLDLVACGNAQARGPLLGLGLDPQTVAHHPFIFAWPAQTDNLDAFVAAGFDQTPKDLLRLPPNETQRFGGCVLEADQTVRARDVQKLFSQPLKFRRFQGFFLRLPASAPFFAPGPSKAKRE